MKRIEPTVMAALALASAAALAAACGARAGVDPRLEPRGAPAPSTAALPPAGTGVPAGQPAPAASALATASASASASDAPPTSDALVLRTPPADLREDGDPGEWADTRPWLERADAKVWLGADAGGLVVAGELDRKVGAGVAALVVTTPVPELPALGYFSSPGSLLRFERGEDCATEASRFGGGAEAQARCRAWLPQQVGARAALRARFERRYPLATARAGERLRFELRIARAAFPAVTALELSELEIALELPGGGAARARVALPTPLVFAPATSLLARLLVPVQAGVVPDVVTYFVPTRPHELHYLFNEQTWASSAKEPSPEELVVDLDQRRQLAAQGDLVLEEVLRARPPVGFHEGNALVTRRGATVVDVRFLGGARPHGPLVRQRPGEWVSVPTTFVGRYNAFGGGTCGACPVAILGVLPISDSGKIGEPWWYDELGGDVISRPEPEQATVSADGRTIEVTGRSVSVVVGASGQSSVVPTGRFRVHYRYDDANGTYERGGP